MSFDFAIASFIWARLKKNFIYDLIHNHCLDWTHRDSTFQFYNLEYLYTDIKTVEENQIKLLNISTERDTLPHFVAKACLHLDFQNETERKPVNYDVKSRYFNVFGGENGYLYLKKIFLKGSKTCLSMMNE